MWRRVPSMPTHTRTESEPPLFFRRASNNSRENFHRTNSTPEQRVEQPGGGHRSEAGGTSSGAIDSIAEGSVAASVWGAEVPVLFPSEEYKGASKRRLTSLQHVFSANASVLSRTIVTNRGLGS